MYKKILKACSELANSGKQITKICVVLGNKEHTDYILETEGLNSSFQSFDSVNGIPVQIVNNYQKASVFEVFYN